MDSKKILLDLIGKYKSNVYRTHDYITCSSLLKKLDAAIINSDPQFPRVEIKEIESITEEEMQMFHDSNCVRFFKSIPVILKSDGIKNKNLTFLKKINFLKADILNNKFKTIENDIRKFEYIYEIVANDKIKENYELLLEFIKINYVNGIIDLETSVNLLFYILEGCNDYRLEVNDKEEPVLIELEENDGVISTNRKNLEEVFEKYGYKYDADAFKYCGGENNFVKYAKIDYVDYVLGKFKRYGVKQEEIYIKKTFYNIVIDNDRETFNSILDFVDQNDCSLGKLLYFPAIFAKRDVEYVMKSRRYPGNGGPRKSLSIVGANADFFKNISLYARLKGIKNITDVDLEAIGKFVSTPHKLVQKNMELLLKFNIISKNALPSSIMSLCGTNTEYLLDRFIESSLYKSYLLPKKNNSGEAVYGIGTSRLYLTTNDLMFYKIKMASLFGDSVLNSNGALKVMFSRNNEEYRGIKLEKSEKGRAIRVVQTPLAMEEIDNIDPSIRRWLPQMFYSRKDQDWNDASLLEFNNIYKFRTFNPIDIFERNSVKAIRVSKIFENDYKHVIGNNNTILSDDIIRKLDNATYCNPYGMEEPVKISDFEYKFYHSSYPNYSLIISRPKVLRLCKLLKDNDCWINNSTSLLEKENLLMSVLLKDSIVSFSEVIMLRTIVREILTNGFIKIDNNSKRGIK